MDARLCRSAYRINREPGFSDYVTPGLRNCMLGLRASLVPADK